MSCQVAFRCRNVFLGDEAAAMETSPLPGCEDLEGVREADFAEAVLRQMEVVIDKWALQISPIVQEE